MNGRSPSSYSQHYVMLFGYRLLASELHTYHQRSGPLSGSRWLPQFCLIRSHSYSVPRACGFSRLLENSWYPVFEPSRYVKCLLWNALRHIFSQFADFWMGWVFHAPWTMVDHETIPSDQLCSMVFTLSNMYMFVCVYVNGFHEDWANCRSQSNAWPVAFVLATLPFFIRLIQSIKRYVDSGLITHLINVCVLVSLIWHVNSTDVVN